MQDETPNIDTTKLFEGVPIEISVIVGKARPTIKELMNMRANEVLVLDAQVDDDVDLYVSDRLIGRGQLEEITEGKDIGRLAVRFKQIFDIKYGQS